MANPYCAGSRDKTTSVDATRFACLGLFVALGGIVRHRRLIEIDSGTRGRGEGRGSCGILSRRKARFTGIRSEFNEWSHEGCYGRLPGTRNPNVRKTRARKMTTVGSYLRLWEWRSCSERIPLYSARRTNIHRHLAPSCRASPAERTGIPLAAGPDATWRRPATSARARRPCTTLSPVRVYPPPCSSTSPAHFSRLLCPTGARLSVDISVALKK